MADDRIFCRIVAGELPSSQVREDDRTVAFMDIDPATRGHVLVVPRTHSADLLEIAADDLAACARTAQTVAGRLKDRLGAGGVNVVSSCGRAAWQSDFHLHLHVIPRCAGDPLRLPWIPAPGDLEAIARAADELRG